MIAYRPHTTHSVLVINKYCKNKLSVAPKHIAD
jgi:hypothetical protein